MYEDKILKCRDCGQEFTFTAGEQEFYAERGFNNAPSRCKACREFQRKRAPQSRQETFSPGAVCAGCGKEALVSPLSRRTTSRYTAPSASMP